MHSPAHLTLHVAMFLLLVVRGIDQHSGMKEKRCSLKVVCLMTISERTDLLTICYFMQNILFKKKKLNS